MLPPEEADGTDEVIINGQMTKRRGGKIYIYGAPSLTPGENASAKSTATGPAAPRTGSKDGEAKAFWHIRPVTCRGQGRDWTEREREREKDRERHMKSGVRKTEVRPKRRRGGGGGESFRGSCTAPDCLMKSIPLACSSACDKCGTLNGWRCLR